MGYGIHATATIAKIIITMTTCGGLNRSVKTFVKIVLIMILPSVPHATRLLKTINRMTLMAIVIVKIVITRSFLIAKNAVSHLKMTHCGN